jgi:hypothetical protein
MPIQYSHPQPSRQYLDLFMYTRIFVKLNDILVFECIIWCWEVIECSVRSSFIIGRTLKRGVKTSSLIETRVYSVWMYAYDILLPSQLTSGSNR